ncbi:MAG: hypothetical protein V3S27_01315 [Kiloniellales bacterium]
MAASPAFEDADLFVCQSHPNSSQGGNEARILDGNLGTDRVYQVFILHNQDPADPDGFCQEFALLGRGAPSSGAGGQSTDISGLAEAWKCMRQLTSACRTLGF